MSGLQGGTAPPSAILPTMTHRTTPDLAASWRAPEDAVRVAFRRLRDDLRGELAELATVTSPQAPRGAGPEGRDWDPDDVSIAPRATGGASVWWGHSATTVDVGTAVGAVSTRWYLPRDDEALRFARQVVDAAVSGRVQLGQVEVDAGGGLRVVRARCCRVVLADGTVADPPVGAAAFSARRPAGPVRWTSWAEPYASAG